MSAIANHQILRVIHMASLQDQLLKAGLIDSKKAKQANKEKRKETNLARRSSEEVVDEIKLSAEQARLEKAERDRELNRQRDLELQQKAVAAQIKQLIENHRQPKGAGEGDVEYNFTHGKLIKKIRVSKTVQEQIVRGVLAVVQLGEGYELVPRIVADKIAQRDENAVVVANTKSAQQVDEDDPYKDYVIPDDLMW
jgi:uncharacterized protein YaiL (DUF2058 family)